MTTPEEIKVRVHFLDGGDSGDPRFDGHSAETVEMTVWPHQSLSYVVGQYLKTHDVDVSEMTKRAIKNDTWDIGLVSTSTPSTGTGLTLDQAHVDMVVQWEGRVYFPTYGLRRIDATSEHIRQTIDAGFADAVPDEITVFTYMGRGGDGGGSELVWWLLEHGVDLGAGYGISLLSRLVGRFVRNGRADRRARAVAQSWAHQNLHSPFQLRALADRRPIWTPQDLGTFLKIEPDVARSLLKSLGYESNAAGEWLMGFSKKARKRRARWMAAEGRDAMGAHYEVTSKPFRTSRHDRDNRDVPSTGTS